jgi:signal peptidase I
MEQIENSQKQENKPRGVLKEILDWLQIIVIAVVVSLVIRQFVFEPVRVDGRSMENTMYTDQRLIVYKLGYYFSQPKPGDIVVLEVQEGLYKYLPFNNPGEIDYIKRVIGVPGDRVDLRDGQVYVNDIKQNEPYAVGRTEEYRDSMDFPVTVPQNKLLVMGDNRQESKDGRQIGFIDIKKIKGKAIFRIWPFKDIGMVK